MAVAEGLAEELELELVWEGMGMEMAEEGSLVCLGKESMVGPGLVSVAGSLADLAAEERKSLVWGIQFCSLT